MDTSEHCKEVYAYYGLAMYRAQCIEQSIIQLLIFFDFFHENAANYESAEKWERDFDGYDSALSKHTMGRLIAKLKQLKAIDKELEDLLSLALQKRNWLAHSYYFDKAAEFISESGRNEMISDLEEMIKVFNKVEILLDPITKELSDKYGLTEAVLDEVQQKMYEEANGDL